MKVVLPDNSELELPDGATGPRRRACDRAEARRAGRARPFERRRCRTCGCRSRTVSRSRSSRPATQDDPDALCVLRHSSAHLLAEAVRRLYPGVKIAIGPPIENGFYYDFEFPEPISEDDLPQDRGRDPARARGGPRVEPRGGLAPTRRASASRRRASRTRSSSSAPPRAAISLYTQGDFTDLCRGPHLQNSKPIKAIKLTGLAGAYWRGDEHNTQLTRIYGTALLLAGRPRRVPRTARGGAPARPPQARASARPLPPRGELAGLAVLASEGDGDLERRSRTCAAARTRSAATSR